MKTMVLEQLSELHPQPTPLKPVADKLAHSWNPKNF